MNKHKMKRVKLAVAVGLATATAQGWAQGAMTLEEVVVTAQKRDQSAQDVPSTINVLSASQLADFNLQDFSDLENMTPGLTTESLSARAGSIAIRGIDYNPNSAAAQAVDVYWNDIPVRGGGGVFQQMFDLERVEVLKGPQGTLQGRSSPAGAIMLHTAKPDLEQVEGFIKTTVDDGGTFNTSGAVSLPIVPGKLSTRIAMVYNEAEPAGIENVVDGSKTESETTAGRISVAWLATDSLNVDFAYQYLETEFNDFNSLIGSPLLDPTLPVLKPEDRKGIQVLDGEGDAEYQRASLNLDWDLGSHSLHWVAGYSDVVSTANRDRSEGNQRPEDAQLQILEDDSDFWSHEVRLSNNDGDVWEYMIGAYYSEEDGDFIQRDFRIGGGPDRDRYALAPFTYESTGVFTHNIFHLNDNWTAQLGLRWQEVDSTVKTSLFAGPTGFFGQPEGELVAVLVPQEFENRSDDAVTGAVNIQYQFNDSDTMVYATYATGYRPGGVTVAGAPLSDDLLAFDEEDSWSVELGFKSTVLGGRGRINAAVFYQDFDNYIARVKRVTVATSPTTVSITDNGDAEVTGIEADFDFLISDNWRIGGAFSYTDSVFKDGAELVCNQYDEGGNVVIPPGQVAGSCDVGGDKLGPQPELTATLNSEYTATFGDSLEGYLRGLYRYVGDREDVDIDGLDPYQTFDLYLGVRDVSGRWDVGLFARNVFDEDEIIRGESPTTVRRQPTGYQLVDVVPERAIGLNASYHF